jgi:hypothetical protein
MTRKRSIGTQDLAGGGVSRRAFIRGLGACLALPAFETFGGSRSFGATAAGGSVSAASAKAVRTAFIYVPNGTIPSAWWPAEKPGADFQLPKTLQPLAEVKGHLQILGGLDDKSAEAGGDGAGDHARAGGTFLTGVRIRKTAGSDIHAGVSIDQVMARKLGHMTRFPSLELTCDSIRKSGNCDSGYSCVYGYNLSWTSPTQPVTPEPNPRLLFERLFGAGSREARAESLRRRKQESRSILDFVMDDARRIERNLDGRDRQKLDEYLSSVRDIEQRISRAENFGIANPDVDEPEGIPAAFTEYVDLMYDMLLLAFQTDSTRVATFLLAGEGSNRTFPEIGITEGHHNLSHHEDRQPLVEKVQRIDQFYVERFARFLKRMAETKEPDGTALLDNSMILYGSGNANGNIHSHTNLPILLAGSGGGKFQTDRYLRKDGTPLSNLFLSMADCAGVSLERHGDSTGRLI